MRSPGHVWPTVPESGASSPAKMRTRVDLPQPFEPINPRRSHAGILKEMFCRTG